VLDRIVIATKHEHLAATVDRMRVIAHAWAKNEADSTGKPPLKRRTRSSAAGQIRPNRTMTWSPMRSQARPRSYDGCDRQR
jgi:hypothetical protein